MANPCSSCGSTRVEDAELMGAGLQPARASAWRKALAAPQLKARLCLDCGAVDGFRVDAEQIRSMLGEP